MLCYRLFILLFVVLLPSISCKRRDPFYRKDYTYIEEYDAFYKLHWDLNGISWNSAFLTCDDEGAMLFYPKVEGEWKLVKNLTNTLAELPNVTDIFVGLHDEFGVGEFMTVDGQSTPTPVVLDDTHVPGTDCILMDMNTGEYKVASCTPPYEFGPLPFVCKKVDDQSCLTIDKGYKYIEPLKKCYKINRRQKMWQEAMQTCFMEGGILAVPENDREIQSIHKLLSSVEPDQDQRFFIGIRRMFAHGDYFTVKGHKFSSKMYPGNNENNGYRVNEYGDVVSEGNSQQVGVDCASIQYRQNDRFFSQECGVRLPFVCEMQVST